MVHKKINQVLFILILVSIFLSLNAKPEVIKLKYTSLLEHGFTKEECLEVLKGEIQSKEIEIIGGHPLSCKEDLYNLDFNKD